MEVFHYTVCIIQTPFPPPLPAGPLSNTVVDFWRAVWQEEVGSIVMVTNLKEGNHVKCHQYWPSSGSAQYGPFTVILAEQLIFADYVIRHLHIAVSHFDYSSI